MLTLIDGILAILVEIALLVGVGRGGFAVTGGGAVGWLAALAAVAVVVAIWAVWAAPASPRRLPMPELALLKAALFAVGTVAWTTGPGWAWPVFAPAAFLSLVLGIIVAT